MVVITMTMITAPTITKYLPIFLLRFRSLISLNVDGDLRRAELGIKKPRNLFFILSVRLFSLVPAQLVTYNVLRSKIEPHPLKSRPLYS